MYVRGGSSGVTSYTLLDTYRGGQTGKGLPTGSTLEERLCLCMLNTGATVSKNRIASSASQTLYML